MSVPTWATIVGVLMLLLGSCGAYNNINKINIPTALNQSSEIIDQVTSEIKEKVKEEANEQIEESKDEEQADTSNAPLNEELNIDSADMEAFENIFGSIEEMMVFTDYYKKWIVRLGFIGVAVALVYFLAGLFLVMGKPFALKLAYVALGLSLLFMIFQIVIVSMDDEGGMFSRWSVSFGSYFMILTNIVLFLVIATADKTYFYQHEVIQE